MVVITIFIEGGVLENKNIDLQTLNNSQILREGFHKLLRQKFGNRFSLEVEIGASVNQTIKFLKQALEKRKNVFAIIDLDAPASEKKKRLLELVISDKDTASRVIFMVQEMEAWILSQPDKIEACYKGLKRRKPDSKLCEDKILKNVAPETISKPSDKLHTLLGRYFQVEKKGKISKKKYNKLKDAGDLLELLDYSQLEQVFSDVKSLTKKLK